MKKGEPLKRTPLVRKTPFRFSGSLRSYTPSASDVVKTRRKTGKHVGESNAKKLAKHRSGGDCEVVIPGLCVYRGFDFHHRLFRSQGGKWEIVNGLYVCRPCHRALTNTAGHRAEYERNGWIVPSHGDPASTEVLMWHKGRQDWFLLLEDGSVELAEFPESNGQHPDDLEVPREQTGLDGAA